MSFDFGGSANVITSVFVPPSLPFSMGCWFNDASVLSTSILMIIGTDSARYQIQTDASSHACARVQNGSTNPISVSTGTYAGGAWNSAIAVFAATNSRIIYLNNTMGNLETTSAPISPVSEMDIGARKLAGVFGAGFTGKIANATVWDAELTARDVLEFFAAKPGCRIRPQNVLFYAPLYRTAQDLAEGIALTVSGPTASNTHPPMRGS